MMRFDQPSRPEMHRSARAGGAAPWGPAWVGAVVALPVFVALQLLFIACGWMALGTEGAGSGVAASIASALLSVIALFVGGLAGGTTSRSGSSVTTVLQGTMTWALTAAGVLLLGLLGGGPVAGTPGHLVRSLTATVPSPLTGTAAVAPEALPSAQHGAGWTALWLGVAFAAAVVGTGAGEGLTRGAGIERAEGDPRGPR